MNFVQRAIENRRARERHHSEAYLLERNSQHYLGLACMLLIISIACAPYVKRSPDAVVITGILTLAGTFGGYLTGRREGAARANAQRANDTPPPHPLPMVPADTPGGEAMATVEVPAGKPSEGSE